MEWGGGGGGGGGEGEEWRGIDREREEGLFQYWHSRSGINNLPTVSNVLHVVL